MDIAEILNLVLENTPDSVGIFDECDRLVYYNHRFADVFCIPFEQTIGMTHRQLVQHCFDTRSGVKIDTQDFESWWACVEFRHRQQAHRFFESDLIDGRWMRFTQLYLENKYIVFWGTDITEIKEAKEKLKIAMERFSRLAHEDELTGVSNRRAFLDLADKEIKRSLSIALLDIDDFKKVNDTVGHAAGDYVLKYFAAFFKQNLRDTDLFSRIGGEEFIIILPETDVNETFILANRLRETLSKKIIHLEGCEQDISVTCSIGISQLCAEIVTIDDLMSAADDALYFSKSHGRNLCTTSHR